MKKGLFFLLICTSLVQAQNVTISPDGITPEIKETYPRISYNEILTLQSPEIGDIAYDITFLCMRVYNGSRWVCTYQIPGQSVADGAFIASAGGPSYDSGYAVAVDDLGNVYMTGSYQGTAIFGSTSISSQGLHDIFVAKYNSNGLLLWVQSSGGSSSDSGKSIAVDGSGNVYVAGSFRETANFDGTDIISLGAMDIFVSKYNSNGTLQWVLSAGSISSDHASSVAVDDLGNVYITGGFQDTATFGDISVTSEGDYDMFVCKYNSNGTPVWVKSSGGSYQDIGNSVAVDLAGNVYLAGYFYGTVLFGGIYNRTSAGGYDIFVAKYNNSGAILWLTREGGVSNDFATSLALDASRNVYITGNYQGAVTFGDVEVSSSGEDDIFLAKYSPYGHFQWVRSAGYTNYDYGFSIAVDTSSNVYVTGNYNGTAIFDNNRITSAGFVDIFIVKYDTHGVLRWVRSAGGTSTDYGNSVAVNYLGDVYITGSCEGGANFGAVSISSVGGSDIFLARISQ